MAENKLADLSTEFAIQILKLTDGIKGHYSLSNQLERSGTSIGANIREAKYAQSRPDFIAKLQIALKECYETEYWLEIAQKAELISEDVTRTILHDWALSVECSSHPSTLQRKTQTSEFILNFSQNKMHRFLFKFRKAVQRY